MMDYVVMLSVSGSSTGSLLKTHLILHLHTNCVPPLKYYRVQIYFKSSFCNGLSRDDISWMLTVRTQAAIVVMYHILQQ